MSTGPQVATTKQVSIGWYKVKIFSINNHKQPPSGQSLLISVEIITRHFGINDTNYVLCSKHNHLHIWSCELTYHGRLTVWEVERRQKVMLETTKGLGHQFWQYHLMYNVHC